MRTIWIAMAMALTACGGTPLEPPQNDHDPGTVQAGYLQCLSQAQGGSPVSLPDGGTFFPATLPDGAVVADYYTPQQCDVYYADEDAGVYPGP